MEATCIICKVNLDLHDAATVGDKGRKTLVLASIQRDDGLQQLLEETSPLKIHVHCRNNYIRGDTIIAEKRKSSASLTENDDGTQTRSGDSTFEIQRDCIFCTETIAVDNKIPAKRRKLISHVETLEFQETVLKHASDRQDDWGNAVQECIQYAFDLVAAEANYHRHCAQVFLRNRDKQNESVGRPTDRLQDEAFQKLCVFLDENDECQYSVAELLEYMDGFLNGQDGYSMKHFKQKLKDYYGDDITITRIQGKSSIVSFRDAAHKILHERWITDKVTDASSESERIIDMAASIILDDIRLRVYDCDEYPNMEDTDNGDTLIPDSLKHFMHKLLDRKGKSSVTINRRCTALAHSIISACRPRSFISPILLGLAVYIHRKYASRELLDILSSISFSDDYKVQRLEYALISCGEPSYSLGVFTQFVFDNAYFNVATLTGHNTFHSMGGIACVTPPGIVNSTVIKRTVKIPSAETMGTFGQIPIKTYSKPSVPGLQLVIIGPLNIPDEEPETLQSAAALDCLWVIGSFLELSPCPSWSGFMKVAMNRDEYERTRIEVLPFINLDPTNLSTIYTALCFAQKQCEKHGVRICPVTFDQPLYLKATEIVAAKPDLDKVIVRLGGFHLLMSYLGSIGEIMSGSGLAELWETVYAKGTVVHMLTGHAFSRAQRANILTSAALICVLLETRAIMTNIDKDHVQNIYMTLLNHEQKPMDTADENYIKHLSHLMDKLLDQVENQSRTGKLWVQYIRQVALMQLFIRAERTGDWRLHMYCVRKMIPHFHAAGHLPYAKTSRLYLQQMESLEQTMPEEEYTLFTEKGYFTIRRTNAFWGGNFSDQTIEQFLMRMLKTSGGMTRGRGITSSTLTKWVHAMPRCVPICDAIEQFTGVHTRTSEQHKDMHPSSQSRDNRDLAIFVQWLQAHPPFAGYESDHLVSLSTGIVADTSVNCDNAVEIGQAAASQMTGSAFTNIKLHRTDKVKTIGAMSKTVNVRGQGTVVNPSLLFNRITCILNNSSQMGTFLAYELAPQPPSLFHDGIMRKPAKSSLGILLKSMVTQQSNVPENGIFVLDGGHLLQTVVWPYPSMYCDVYNTYISYTLRHYAAGSTVVFDGYSSNMSTKIAEQRRRAQKCTSSDIMFDDNIATNPNKAAFLANSNNKKRLIQSLCEKMLCVGIHVKQAEADADTLIVSTAMLVARAPTSTDMYMLCHSNPTTLYSIREIQHAIGDTSTHLMFLHAITGCDTVSAIYRQGKRKAFNVVYKSKECNQSNTFTKSGSSHDEVTSAGESFILKLYGAEKFNSLDEYRHITYKEQSVEHL